MGEWRVVYAGLRERFPQVDRAVVRTAAEKYSNEDDAAFFIACTLSKDCSSEVPADASQGSGVEQTLPLQSGDLLHQKGEVTGNEHVESHVTPQAVLDMGTRSVDNWHSYLEAAVSAANRVSDAESEAPAGSLDMTAVTLTRGSAEGALEAPEPSAASAEMLTEKDEEPPTQNVAEAELSAERTPHGSQDTVVQDQTAPPLETLVQQSVEEKEKLAAELASYAQMRNGLVSLEGELDAARERATVAGQAEQRQLEQTQRAVAQLREENERRYGEVHGEMAMLGTEAKELRRNLALLQHERRNIRTKLEHLQEGLRARMGVIESAIAVANAEAAQRRAVVQSALDVVQAKLASAEVEKADLDKEEAEANKLHLFIMEKGTLVDSMLAEVAMLKEDLQAVERLASDNGFGAPAIPSSFLSIGQAGSALLRSSTSQGESVLGRAADARALALTQTTTVEAETIPSPDDSEDNEESSCPPSLKSDSQTSAEGDEQSVQASLPSLLPVSGHSEFESTTSSMRLSQAPGEAARESPAVEERQAFPSIGESQEAFDVGSAHAGHMAMYGPSPSNLTSQYMGVFQQQVVPYGDQEEHEDEGWAMLESDSSSSDTHH